MRNIVVVAIVAVLAGSAAAWFFMRGSDAPLVAPVGVHANAVAPSPKAALNPGVVGPTVATQQRLNAPPGVPVAPADAAAAAATTTLAPGVPSGFHTQAQQDAQIADEKVRAATAQKRNKMVKRLGTLVQPAALTDEQYNGLRQMLEAELVELDASGSDAVAVRRHTDDNAVALLSNEKQRAAWSKWRNTAEDDAP